MSTPKTKNPRKISRIFELKNAGLDPKVIITRLLRLMQSPDYIEELRMKLEMIRGFNKTAGI